MARAKIVVTITHEYDIIDGDYPEGLSYDAMVELDRKSAEAEPGMIAELNDAVVVVTGELVERITECPADIRPGMLAGDALGAG